MSKYNSPLPWKLNWGFLCIAYLYIAIDLSLSNEPFGWNEVLLVLLCSVNAGLCFFCLFDHLLVDDNGFQYRAFGIVYSGKWSDIQRCAVRGLWDGVYIPKAKLTSGNNWYTPKDFFVPLSLFIPKWQKSMLRRRISTYVLLTKNQIMNQ